MKNPLPPRPIDAAGATFAAATVRQLFQVEPLISGTDIGPLMAMAYAQHLTVDIGEPTLAALIDERREILAHCVAALSSQSADWFTGLARDKAMAVILALAKVNAAFLEPDEDEPEQESDEHLNEAERRARQGAKRKKLKTGDGFQLTLCALVEAGYGNWKGVLDLTYAELRYLAKGHYALQRDRDTMSLDIACAAQSSEGYNRLRGALTKDGNG